MAELLRIQKIFRRLRTLFAIFAALCLVIAVTAVAAAVVWGVKGDAYLSESGFISRVAEALDLGGKNQTLGILIMDAVCFIALGFLLLMTVRCLKAEIREGTPFSDKGAGRTKALGFLYFFISLGTEMAAVILRESFSVAGAESLGVAGGMATGIALLIMSSIMRYGTRLQDMILLKDVPLPEPEMIETPPLEYPGPVEPAEMQNRISD